MVKTAIFDLIHLLQTTRRSENYFPPLMYLLNLVIHVIIYLSIPSINMLHIDTFTAITTPIYVFTAFILVLLLQALFYLLKKRQLYLTQQLSVFRFIISPLFALNLLQTASNGSFSVPLGLVLFILNKTLSSLLSRAILYEIHRNYTLNIMQTCIIFEFDSFEIVLISNCFLVDPAGMLIFAGLTLAASLLTGFKHFLRLESEDTEYRILHFANIVHIAFSLFYVLKLTFNTLQSGYIFATVVPLVSLGLFLVYTKAKTTRDNVARAFQGELSFDQFIESIDCFLVLTRQDYSNSKRSLINYIYAIISQHEAKCTMPGCQLQSPSTQDQLKNMSPKSIHQLTHKIIKKIEWLLEDYRKKTTEDLTIFFTYLKFYAEYLNHRIKMQSLLNEIEEEELSWPYQFQFWKYKEVCKSIQNIDNIDVIKDEQIYIQFQNNLIATLNCMIEFWVEFNEEKVDLGKIMQISAKLFPYKARIEQIFENQLRAQKFTSFRIMKLYNQYLLKILNKYEFAAKVEDILNILAHRLKDKQDIQYLSKESEAGFIVICLSESKLGDIFMVNEKACDIFRFTRKEMLSLRVNAIMPTVIADIHDQILTDFLKKKRKKYNTDQRLLFGKDGNGYIFPVQLQLQRASFSSNDEYIFIASVAPEKLRSAPIYCIVDHEGEITDYTASFRNIFFSSSKKSYNKNIQQIIPGYFDIDYNQKSEEIRHFTSFLKNRKLGQIEVKFDIMPLIVKTVHEGYLIKMSYNNEKTVSSYSNLCLTENLKSLIIKSEVKCIQNSYNNLNNCFQFEKNPHRLSLRANGPEFTLPFLSYEDMAFFANSTEVKEYGKNIKTIRYIHNHFQRIDEDQSFNSESYGDEEKVDVREKIEELKHKYSRKEDQSLTNTYKIIANLIILVALAIAATIYTVYSNEIVEEQQFLASFDSQKKILYYLPEYIISFTCADAGINSQFFLSHLQQIEPILISNIINSDIDEKYKEDIMKIIYLKSPSDLMALIETNTFSIAESDYSVRDIFKLLWSLMIAISVVFLLTFVLMFYHLQQILFSIYMLFLSLKETSIKRIEDSCRSLIDKIYFQSQENVEKDEEKKINEEEEENQIEKIKQFKNMNRKQDFYIFVKITVPLILLIGFLFLMLFLSDSQFRLYQTLKEQHNTMFETIPASSIEFAEQILSIMDSIYLNVDNKYELYYQQLEMTIQQFNLNSQQSNFLDNLYGNICTNSAAITPQMQLSCNTIGNGVLTTGIESSINFIAHELKDIAAKSVLSTSNIELIFSLQFLFINPALMSIEDKMEDILISSIQSYGSFFTSMVGLIICYFIFYDIYLVVYPFKAIEVEIKLTNEMIGLMPDNAGQESSRGIPISEQQ